MSACLSCNVLHLKLVLNTARLTHSPVPRQSKGGTATSVIILLNTLVISCHSTPNVGSSSLPVAPVMFGAQWIRMLAEPAGGMTTSPSPENGYWSCSKRTLALPLPGRHGQQIKKLPATHLSISWVPVKMPKLVKTSRRSTEALAGT